MAAIQLESNIDNENPSPQHDLMNDKRFKSIYEAISESELGSIIPPPIRYEIAEFGRIIMDSTLLTVEEEDYMLQMIESQKQTEKFKYCDWKLLCRASDGGGTQQQFHDACHGKKHTVCLCLYEDTGVINGGYAAAGWESNWDDGDIQANGDNAFVFVIRPIHQRNVIHQEDVDNKKGLPLLFRLSSIIQHDYEMFQLQVVNIDQ